MSQVISVAFILGFLKPSFLDCKNYCFVWSKSVKRCIKCCINENIKLQFLFKPEYIVYTSVHSIHNMFIIIIKVYFSRHSDLTAFVTSRRNIFPVTKMPFLYLFHCVGFPYHIFTFVQITKNRFS